MNTTHSYLRNFQNLKFRWEKGKFIKIQSPLPFFWPPPVVAALAAAQSSPNRRLRHPLCRPLRHPLCWCHTHITRGREGRNWEINGELEGNLWGTVGKFFVNFGREFFERFYERTWGIRLAEGWGREVG